MKRLTIAVLLGCALGGTALADGALPAASPAPRLVLYGGGDTLSADTGNRNELLGYFASVVKGARVSFCRSDGALAKAIFTGQRSATGPCLAATTPAAGFGAPAATADFVASGVPLTGADVATFLADAGTGTAARGEPVQIPYLATAVSLLYNNPDVTGRLRLSISTLCRIADGEIADWNRIPVDPTNPSGPAYPRRPLRFVYRADRADTTFALANFLSSQRPDGTRTCSRFRERFALNDRFAPGVLPQPLPPGATTRAFIPAIGDAAAAACIAGRAGSCGLPGRRTPPGGTGTIGYVDDVGAFATALEAPLGVATVYVVRDGLGRDEDPIADLPGPATRVRSFATDLVLARFVPNGRPANELVAADLPPRRAGCIAVVPPASYAFPDVGYPIVSITNLDVASLGNGERAEALRTLAALTNNGKNFSAKKIRTIDANDIARGTRGVSVLPLPSLRKHPQPNLATCIGA